jgi:hypothetical protein
MQNYSRGDGEQRRAVSDVGSVNVTILYIEGRAVHGIGMAVATTYLSLFELRGGKSSWGRALLRVRLKNKTQERCGAVYRVFKLHDIDIPPLIIHS